MLAGGETKNSLPAGYNMFTAYIHGQYPLLSNGFHSALFFPLNVCWGANAASHGLVQADAALAATPLP